MPKFEKQNLKRIDPRWFLNETVEKTKLEQLQEVLTEQTQVLKRGMKETDPNGPIHKLQTYLKDKKLYRGKLDGKYGRGTQLAVRALQLQLIRGKKLPPKQPSGKSSADGIAGAQTLAAIGIGQGATPLPGAASATSIPDAATSTQQRASSSSGNPTVNAIAQRLQSDLDGWVDEAKMNNIVKLLTFADNKGILAAVSQKYRNLTGNGLQDAIRGVSGVHKPKNQALAILGGEYAERDLTTKVDKKVGQAAVAVKRFLGGLFGGSGPREIKKLSKAANKDAYLLFDGDKLHWVGGGQIQESWPATSGKLWFLPAGSRDQSASSFGPIPEHRYGTGGLESMKRNVGDPGIAEEAEYLIREMISTYIPSAGVTPAPHGWAEKKGDAAIFAKIAWGNFRIQIKGQALGRAAFFIHGGTLRGSSGCIDLGEGMDDFAKFWAINTISKKKGPPLVVNYKGKPEPPDTPTDKLARSKKKNIVKKSA